MAATIERLYSRSENLFSPERQAGDICVMKFGGTSVSSADAILQVAYIVESYRRDGKQIIVVPSALADVTDELYGICDAVGLNQRERAAEILNNIREKHSMVCDGLEMPPICRLDVRDSLTFLFDEIQEGIDTITEVTPEVRDWIASYGERASIKLVGAQLGQFMLVETVESSTIIQTDDHFERANPDFEETEKNIDEKITPLVKRGITPIISGFSGATKDGRTTTLGRNSSDYSAAVIARLSGARKLYIWKDVDGVYNDDPRLTSDVVTLSELTFEDLLGIPGGNKVINPKVIDVLGDTDVSVHVKNTFNPDHPGTRILRNHLSCRTAV
ncbi:MAG: aspartate kinase [bacterium]|nr:aspartate kinase [bacterium]